MRKYIIESDRGIFESTSRNAKQHVVETGANKVIVYTKKKHELVSAARRWGDGTITNTQE